MDRLHENNTDSAVSIINQVMGRFGDFWQLVLTQKNSFSLCKSLARSIMTATTHFGDLWFFFLLILLSVDSFGAHSSRLECQEFFTFCEEGEFVVDSTSLGAFLRLLFADSPIESLRPACSFADFSAIANPMRKCIEYFYLLNDPDALQTAYSFLAEVTYLWPVALLWVISPGDRRGNHMDQFLTLTHPNHKLIDMLFYYASIVLKSVNQEENWRYVIAKPNYKLLIRFKPVSISEVEPVIVEDLKIFTQFLPFSTRSALRAVISWRAWIIHFTAEPFVQMVIRTVMGLVAGSGDPVRIISFFQSAACILLVVSDGDEDLIMRILNIVLDVIESERRGTDCDGEGLAGFCILTVLGLPTRWKSAWQQILEFREKLINETSDRGATRIAFCQHLIRAAVYVPGLHDTLTRDVFASSFMKNEWQAAIDYFIAYPG
jgi:hypothetical protein